MAGEFVITSDAFLPNEPSAIKEYKDTHRDMWGEAQVISTETGEVFDA